MPIIDYPTINVKYYAIQNVYLKADMVSIIEYCSDKGITYVSHQPEQQRFSNDGGLAYRYFGLPVGVTGGTSAWITQFGYDQVVSELNYTP